MMILEIRTYRLRPGTITEFVQIVHDHALPQLAAAGIRTVGCGASLVAEDGHEEAYLMRAFESVAQRDSQEADRCGAFERRLDVPWRYPPAVCQIGGCVA